MSANLCNTCDMWAATGRPCTMASYGECDCPDCQGTCECMDVLYDGCAFCGCPLNDTEEQYGACDKCR